MFIDANDRFETEEPDELANATNYGRTEGKWATEASTVCRSCINRLQ
jgi:hypothetical protein